MSRGGGAGTWTGANGHKYVGQFKDGVKHGQGMSCACGDEWSVMDGSDVCSPLDFFFFSFVLFIYVLFCFFFIIFPPCFDVGWDAFAVMGWGRYIHGGRW